jgi:hypothetical protein
MNRRSSIRETNSLLVIAAKNRPKRAHRTLDG